ncbi:group II intron reverse transcriptase/maturase [Budvicia aquatica]|uniref:Group II intron reverse transcriptase/maturase n=1 Tax=Budvicia aquatica TaxID=82979 RepID=A0A2C6DU92_9GAMM|nr:group II intron reverse transcriptase/maturase [Budvicia aquatica]PHI32738.1 group II intron reverse transcriptase/maturase [Budvicia aquatica]PHI32777.1 group II intron reverse transcriptase/maturase [Budvicia aquatica]VFS51027.1 Group II intron-encoded protein ltrA [Budvicia aquatica]VFS52084.1 Group II intron-encoded protein ltrA [Budvicia aquatica]VFS52661.1 Group II intron-encoded protein ltrA [Budvicia aquatica]
MNTLSDVSATSRLRGWHSIDWKRCHYQVRKLQIRIAKATREKQWRRVKKLQRMLTRSFTAKALAVKRVTENTGKKTPGVDGKTWSTPEDKWQAITLLKRKGYQPLPLKRVYIPKPNGKKRPLGIPVMLDRAMQALYLLALEPVSETTADHNSYGFRPVRSTADAITQLYICCAKRKSAPWILEADIKGCFDNISHDWLLAHIPMDKQILRKWLKAGYMDKGSFNLTRAGTPQGGIISPVLANMALDGLEKQLEEKFWQTAKLRAANKVNYVRYADDFIITGSSKTLLEQKVKPVVISFMKERGLTLSIEKTAITHIEEGFDFLGQNIRKYKGKFLIKPSKKNLKNFLNKIRTIITENKTTPAYLLIAQLNPVIRGWANYHRHVVAKKAYSYVDNQIWSKLWQWCVRRHPRKSRRWIKAKYFTSREMRNWIFEATDIQGRVFTLCNASSTPIKRHVKIRKGANRYDPSWEIYFERRLDSIWKDAHEGRRKIIALWNKQARQCPLCEQPFSTETSWNVHHKVMKTAGGGDELSNLVLLHPNCHRQYHSSVAGYREGGNL